MVSIILPTYNRAHLIAESIRSVLEQTYSDFELLVVDDGSDDNTDTIVSAFKDERIRYFNKEHTGHTSILKNFALGVAKGDLIGFIDSDDLWKKEKLGKQVEVLNGNKTVGFSISDVTTFRDSIILIDHSYQLQNTIEYTNIFERLVKNRMLVYNPTLVIRKECFNRVGLFNEQMFSGDYHFNMRLSYYYDAAVIYETLVLRRAHDSNMSELLPFENYAEYIETYEYLRRNKMIDFTDVYKAKTNAYLKMGNIYSAQGAKRQAFNNYFRSFKYGIRVPLDFLRLWRTLRPAKRK